MIESHVQIPINLRPEFQRLETGKHATKKIIIIKTYNVKNIQRKKNMQRKKYST